MVDSIGFQYMFNAHLDLCTRDREIAERGPRHHLKVTEEVFCSEKSDSNQNKSILITHRFTSQIQRTFSSLIDVFRKETSTMRINIRLTSQ